MPVLFHDSSRLQPRRNIAALYRASVSPPTGIQVPTQSLALTAYAPSITVAGFQETPKSRGAVFVEAVTLQPRRNIGAIYLAVSSGASSGQTIAVPITSLNLLTYSPTVNQSSPVLVGQDLQGDWPADVWQPARRSFLHVLQQPGSNAVNIPLASLTLAAYAPGITVAGVVSVPLSNLTLTAYAPTINQQNSGRVDVPLSQMSLAGYPPSISVDGPGVVNVDLLTLNLTAYAPTITQAHDPERIRILPLNARIRIQMK